MIPLPRFSRTDIADNSRVPASGLLVFRRTVIVQQVLVLPLGRVLVRSVASRSIGGFVIVSARRIGKVDVVARGRLVLAEELVDIRAAL